MRKRGVLRVGGSVARGSLAFPSGGRRRRVREGPGGVPGMLRPLELAPGLSRHVADVAAGNELRGTVQVRRRHYRRLLWLTTVSHFSSTAFHAVMSNQHTRGSITRSTFRGGSCSQRLPLPISPRSFAAHLTAYSRDLVASLLLLSFLLSFLLS